MLGFAAAYSDQILVWLNLAGNAQLTESVEVID